MKRVKRIFMLLFSILLLVYLIAAIKAGALSSKNHSANTSELKSAYFYIQNV
ncbi:MAG: hypothetical protein Q8876_03000 [Bacillota bacterium]|nr:hypothetical protein [Bacillota bacterium]